MMATSAQASLRVDRPLVLGLLLTSLASIGSGAVTSGIYFLTESALNYDRPHNYTLALVMGIAYIVGAAGIGSALRTSLTKLVSTRTVGVFLLLAVGFTAPLPVLVVGSRTAVPPAWTLWTLVTVFGLLTGCLWPIVEAYISGGRRGSNLRSAIGWFNIVWASAVIVSMWLIAPYAEKSPMTVLLWVGAAHVLAGLLLLPLPRHPPRHLDDEPHVFDPRYPSLLRVSRVLLPASYLLISNLGPTIPAVLGVLGVSMTWKAPAFSAWLVARLCTFALFEFWHGWHGRWLPLLLGGVGLIVGFALAVLSPRCGPIALPAFFAGLAIFGCSAGLVYVASLYYGMEIGGSNVDDGGRHETVIGFGYAGGPACGLLAVAAAGRESDHLDLAVVAIAGPIAALIVIIGLIGARRLSRTRPVQVRE
ncbi:MAG: hypothetical protein KJZ65_11025 [Phycisphaerales bacterium]|nr:hypothetical protein [Phycisphaerales bacterium]